MGQETCPVVVEELQRGWRARRLVGRQTASRRCKVLVDLPTMILGARRPTAPGSEQGYLRQVAAWSRLDMLIIHKR